MNYTGYQNNVFVYGFSEGDITYLYFSEQGLRLNCELYVAFGN